MVSIILQVHKIIRFLSSSNTSTTKWRHSYAKRTRIFWLRLPTLNSSLFLCQLTLIKTRLSQPPCCF